MEKQNKSGLLNFYRYPMEFLLMNTFKRVFSRIDPEQFMNFFLKWASAIRSVFGHELIAVDGKNPASLSNKAAIHGAAAAF
jgi:hypothetical protein